MSKVKNRYYEVERIESHYIRVTDLLDGSQKSIRLDDVETITGNARNAESALVAYADAATIGILDPVTHQTREVRALKWMPVQAGDHVSVIRDGDLLVVVR